MTDSETVGSTDRIIVSEQSLAVQTDEKESEELTSDAMDFKKEASSVLRNACQEQSRMQKMTEEEEEEEEEEGRDDADERSDSSEESEEEKSTDGDEDEEEEEEEEEKKIIGKNDKEEEEREEKEKDAGELDARHKEPAVDKDEDEKAENGESEDADKDDDNVTDTEGGADDDVDKDEVEKSNDKIVDNKGNDNVGSGKSLTDMKREGGESRLKKGKRTGAVKCRRDASKMAPGKEAGKTVSDKDVIKMVSDKLAKSNVASKMASGKDASKLVPSKVARKIVSGKGASNMASDKDGNKMASEKDGNKMVSEKDGSKMVSDKDGNKMVSDKDGNKIASEKVASKIVSDKVDNKMASDKDGKAVTKCGIKAEVADSDSNSSDDSSSFSGSKDGSHVATPQRGRSSEQLRGERGTQETDSEDEDGSSSRATDDSEDAEGAGAAEDAAERVVDNKEDGEDAEADAGDSEDSEDSSGSDDDRVLVERGGKFSFLSVKDLNSQEKKLYGLIPSGSSPALASTPKLQPATGQSGKRQARLPLLGTKRDGVPVGTSGATRSRARFRTTMSDTTVTQAKGEMTSKVGGSISTTTASSTTLRAAQRRRSEKTPSCPTMSLTDRRKAGLVWKPAGPSKAPPTGGRTKSQELKARCSRSASGDVPPGVDPATLYRSPYAFSPERRRELSRRLRDRLDDEKKAEDAKRLEEESRKKEAEQAFNVWVESKRQQSLHQDDLELNPRLSKKLIDATQREAAESAFNDWLQMKRRQRMDEMRRREEERQKCMMALENTMEYRRKAEKAYKRWFKKKQKPALLKRKRIGVGASATAGSFTSGRHHVTAKGQRMLAGATMRREPAQRPPRSLVRKTSSSVNQLPSEPLSLATAANYFRLLYCM